jgi:tyrosyl-tRNA synthetase
MGIFYIEEGSIMTIDEQLAIICKGAADVISPEDLRTKLEESARTGKPLTVKWGLDPSAPDIHLGHTVVLRKIKQLQDLGHRAALVIGDFTGRIGDPTGKSKTRRQLTEHEVLANAATYERQLSKILDPAKTEYLFNSAWLGKLRFADIVELAARTTAARVLERDDFQKRLAGGLPVGMHELFYPLMQGYDSVELKADIELGGTDQRFNILFGRDLQAGFGMPRQAVVLMPLLEGWTENRR